MRSQSNVNHLSDDVIIDQVINGHTSSYAILIERYKSYVYTVALNIVKLEEEAEEVAQDSFIKVFKNLKKFNRESKFSTWLYRITFNTALTARKRITKQTTETLNDSINPFTNQTDQTEQDDQKKFIALAMSRLVEQDAMALTLFYLEELSLDEICKITDLSLSNLKVRLHRARKRFAKELQLLLRKEAVNL